MKGRLSSTFLTRENIIVGVFFAFFLFLLFQGGRLIAPFVTAIIWGGIIVVILYPLYRRLLVFLKGRRNVAAGLMTFLALILVIGPALLLLTLLAAQAVDIYNTVANLIASGQLGDFWNRVKSSAMGFIVAHPYLAELDVKSYVMKGLSDFSSTITAQLGAILKNILLAALNLFIMLFVIFFFFRDGKTYVHTFMEILPFPERRKKPIMKKVSNTFSAVIKGLFLVALFQGFMSGVGFFLFGVPFPVFWGFLTAIASLLPVGGSALVWFPGALYLFFTGSTTKGILMIIWGIVAVSLPDNFLRPLVIGKKAEIPTFFLFLGILGGIQTYGILGVLFGPLVVTLLIAFVEIYREEYAQSEKMP